MASRRLCPGQLKAVPESASPPNLPAPTPTPLLPWIPCEVNGIPSPGKQESQICGLKERNLTGQRSKVKDVYVDAGSYSQWSGKSMRPRMGYFVHPERLVNDNCSLSLDQSGLASHSAVAGAL